MGIEVCERLKAKVGVVVACGVAMILILVLSAGCKSAEGSGAFAAVTVSSPSAEVVRQVVLSVFEAGGYYDASRGRQWFMDRPPSRMGQWMHGGWFGSDDVRERAKLRLIPLSDGKYRLECTAVMVRDAGDPFFEEETRMTGLKSNPYRKMLGEVERRLLEIGGQGLAPGGG